MVTRGEPRVFRGAGLMVAGVGELSVELQPGPDSDAEDLAQLVGRLRAELLDLDVDDVRQPTRGEARRSRKVSAG